MRLLVLTVTLLFSALAGPALADTDPAPARDGVWPLAPRPEVVAGFDPPQTKWGAGHRGVDLLGHVGQPVHASLGGTITFATTLAGRGVVVVDHGGVRTTYEPVSASVAVGDVVGRGAVIGTLQRALEPLLPASLPPLGAAARRDLPQPADPRGRRTGPAAAARRPPGRSRCGSRHGPVLSRRRGRDRPV